MKKLALDLGTLEVWSFATDDEAHRLSGTIDGRQQEPRTRMAEERRDLAECQGTQGADCVSVAQPSPSSVECGSKYGCPSAVDCPSVGCTGTGCPA